MVIHEYDYFYEKRTRRNIGHVTYEEQELIRNSKIVIMGVGGVGGSLTEQLARIGCQNIVICDNDLYEESNLNRQLCTTEELGKYKVDHLESHLKAIDPQMNVSKWKNIASHNIDIILENANIVCLSLDDPIASIIIARKCREKQIPMVESWGIPYLWAWWFTSDSISYEECFNTDTTTLSIEELEENEMSVYTDLFPKLLQFPGIEEMYDRKEGIIEQILQGERSFPSMASFVHLTASYLATEIIFAGILNMKKKVLAPNVVGYDYIRMQPIQIKIN
ncbi:MAG: hypothetical protein BAJALOKI3v1_430003 [Promethearchaeota archaeon]|nr:MAG: hypothetical protein BAJALOKI3v1_430003 [Candidatus Lokiarchaeota archaeon]